MQLVVSKSVMTSLSQDGYDFTIVKSLLERDQALSYSRMRYEDPNGDYGRQERQRKIVEGVAKSIEFKRCRNYQSVLNA